jgi:hypothetical protein
VCPPGTATLQRGRGGRAGARRSQQNTLAHYVLWNCTKQITSDAGQIGNSGMHQDAASSLLPRRRATGVPRDGTPVLPTPQESRPLFHCVNPHL